MPSPPTAAARTAECRRAGSKGSPAAYRYAPSPGTSSSSQSAAVAITVSVLPPSNLESSIVFSSPGLLPSVNVSSPVNPSDSTLAPASNCSGKSPSPPGSTGECAHSSPQSQTESPANTGLSQPNPCSTQTRTPYRQESRAAFRASHTPRSRRRCSCPFPPAATASHRLPYREPTCSAVAHSQTFRAPSLHGCRAGCRTS